MKKFLLVSILALSTLSLAADQTNQNMMQHNMMNDKTSSDMMSNDMMNSGSNMMQNGMNCKMMQKMKQNMMNKQMMMGSGMMMDDDDMMMNKDTMKGYMRSLRNDPEVMKFRIMLQEKKVELMKELSKEDPDFKNVKKINEEMAKIKSEMMTLRMEECHKEMMENIKNKDESKKD